MAPSATACSRPTVLTDVHPDMKVCSRGGVRPGRRGADATPTSTTRSALANDTRYGLQAAIFTPRPRRSRSAPHASSTSAACSSTRCPPGATDQMPYGGVRDSGNTREGPHYAVHEMTETRLVVLG